MALISCPDCGKQISDQAPACLECGRPMASSMVLGSAKPIELTSKRFKWVTVLCVAAIVFGVFGIMEGRKTGDPFDKSLGSWLLFLGVAGYVVNRVRIWWHHK